MKTKNFFAAMCGVFVLAGATIATYTAVAKSQKEMSDLTKQNLEALVQSTREGGEFQKECYDTYSDTVSADGCLYLVSQTEDGLLLHKAQLC